MDILRLMDLTKHFPQYIVEIGVMSDSTHRKEIVQVGMTNAELMFIHENGSPLHHIPARPVLDMTIKWANDTNLVEQTLSKAVDAYFKNYDYTDIDKEIDKMCIKLQNHARRIITDNNGQLAPNAPSTIARKGENYPLHDTGQLARSITCRAIKIKGGKI